jgi:glycosyltransferase involved in cell wall biosynthesis
MLKEAMQCGTPVISSSLLEGTIGGVGRIIKDPTNVHQTSLELKAALDMSDIERNRMIKEGLSWVSQFSWEKVAHKSLSFLESL